MVCSGLHLRYDYGQQAHYYYQMGILLDMPNRVYSAAGPLLFGSTCGPDLLLQKTVKMHNLSSENLGSKLYEVMYRYVVNCSKINDGYKVYVDLKIVRLLPRSVSLAAVSSVEARSMLFP